MVIYPDCQEFNEAYSRDTIYATMAGAIANTRGEFNATPFCMQNKFDIPKYAYIEVANLVFVDNLISLPKEEFHRMVFKAIEKYNIIKEKLIL